MKKSKTLQEEAKDEFFAACKKQGTRDVFADYIWNVVFAASMGYSFSQLHSYSYSIIALQELNLNWFYHPVYWNCACLCVESANAEDGTTSAVDYSEMCKAIYKMRKSNITVSPPSINESNQEFTPDDASGSILYGLAAITGINSQIADQIIANRPYSSFKDFWAKNAYEGSLITASKFVKLIQAGCFDCFEPDRVKVMKQYVKYTYEPKAKLTLANLDNIQALGMALPTNLIRPLNFKKYVCQPKFFYAPHEKFKTKKWYRLNDRALRYFQANCMEALVEGRDWAIDDNGLYIVVDKALDKLYAPTLEELSKAINSPEMLAEYNKRMMRQAYDKLVDTSDPNQWSFEACSYYSGDHELAGVNFGDYNIERFSDLPLEPEFVVRTQGKRSWNQYALTQICGTIIGRLDNRHTLILLTPECEVVNVKFTAGQFGHYKQQLSTVDDQGNKTVIEKPWFMRGTKVIVTGYRYDEFDFKAKKYKNSIFNTTCQKITAVHPDGSIEIQSARIGYEKGDED